MAADGCATCGAESPLLERLRDFTRLLRKCEVQLDTNEAERRALAWIGDELALMTGDKPTSH